VNRYRVYSADSNGQRHSECFLTTAARAVKEYRTVKELFAKTTLFVDEVPWPEERFDELLIEEKMKDI